MDIKRGIFTLRITGGCYHFLEEGKGEAIVVSLYGCFIPILFSFVYAISTIPGSAVAVIVESREDNNRLVYHTTTPFCDERKKYTENTLCKDVAHGRVKHGEYEHICYVLGYPFRLDVALQCVLLREIQRLMFAQNSFEVNIPTAFSSPEFSVALKAMVDAGTVLVGVSGSVSFPLNPRENSNGYLSVLMLKRSHSYPFVPDTLIHEIRSNFIGDTETVIYLSASGLYPLKSTSTTLLIFTPASDEGIYKYTRDKGECIHINEEIKRCSLDSMLESGCCLDITRMSFSRAYVITKYKAQRGICVCVQDICFNAMEIKILNMMCMMGFNVVIMRD